MKNTFKRIISMVLVCMMLVGTLAGISVSAETAAPTVEIVSNNLAYGETIKLMYAVKAENVPEGATVTVTLTDKDNNTYETVADGTVTIDGVECYKFVSERGVPAQNIDAQFTATAAISGTEATDVETYSVLQYLWERLYVSTNATDAQKAMYNALLAYAKAADVVLNGSDSISNLTYVVFNGEGEMYSVGDEIELITDLVAGEGQELVWTVNGDKYTEATYVVTNEFAEIAVEVAEIAAVEMTIPEALEAADGTKVIVTGKVTVAGAWSANYNNMNVTIEDENGNELYVYRLATEVALGDTIVVTGAMDTYNDARQIAQGATAEIIAHEEVVIPEVTIAEALAAADGTNIVVTGTVIDAGSWSSQYNNMNVTIADAEGNSLYIYRLATQVAKGDVIKVTGAMATYQGSRQVGEGATAEIVGEHVCADWYEDATCTAPKTCKLCGATTGEALGHTDENTDGTCDVCGMSTSASYVEETLAIIANASTSGGVVDKTITWTGTNVTFFHEQGASTSAIVATHTDHFRCYKSSQTTISVANGNIAEVVITATSSSYATTLASSLTDAGYTAVANGTTVTVTLDGTTNSISFSHSAGQTRVNSITVTYAE